MQLAVLFWFYKEPSVCKQRLQQIKKLNPGTKVYGLYGGEKAQEIFFKTELEEFLDDFYTTTFSEKDSQFKWIHGDVMILDWFESRGQNLKWDSVAVVQWDLLVFDSFDQIFPGLEKDQMFLSGLRELDAETERKWSWTSPESFEERKNFETFKSRAKEKYQYSPEIYPCCLFVFQIIPRLFFTQWLTVQDRYLGMLEYKVPAFAEIFTIKQYKKDLGMFWSDREESIEQLPMNARSQEIERKYIEEELANTTGYRMFHPYFNIW